MASAGGLAPVEAVVTIDPRTDPAWALLARSRDSRLFHAPEWIRAVADTYGFPVGARMLLDGSRPVAGFPYADVEGVARRRRVSFPFSDYCDPIVSDELQWQALTSGPGSPAPPMTLRCLHNAIPLTDDRFAPAGRARWHAIDLSLAEPWQRLDSSARRAVRRARQAGVRVDRADSTAELRAFFELHLRVRKHKYRMLAQPYSFFERLWQEFGEAVSLLLARVDGAIAAGVFYVEWKDTLYYKFNASDPDLTTARPNDALMWAGIELGLGRGLRRVDLGLSDWDQEGLVRYKRKYASEEKAISFLAWNPETTSEAKSRLARSMPTLVGLLTDERVPDAITEEAGRALYRFFA